MKMLYKCTKKTLNALVRRCTHSWSVPTGHDTGISVYNCVSRGQVPLIVKNPQLVSWYTCGPTVYSAAHIGHASCYMRLDILQNILKHHFNLNIVSTINITDIDDKIIAESRLQKVPYNELSKEYERQFWQDIDALGIDRPDIVVRVSEEIPQIIEFIKRLLDQGFAYKGNDDSIYFDVNAYETSSRGWTYGKLQNIGRENKNATKVKKSAEDFALWKAAKPGEPSWDTSFGPGRPGWHIECSAMASSIFGSTIDIHAGGIDLRFPHHENEEVQSCAYHGCNQWVNYWLHVGHLHLPNAAKMSKSLKNTVSLQEMLETTTTDVFRMACLLTNYKYDMEFSTDLMKLAEANLKNIQNFLNNLQTILIGTSTFDIDTSLLLNELNKTVTNIDASLRKDFDTSSCIKHLHSLINMCNKVVHEAPTNTANSKGNESVAILIAIINYVQRLCGEFGFQFLKKDVAVVDKDFVDIMNVLVNFRHQLRLLSIVRKDREALELCDDVRNECKKLGYNLKDHPKISTWSR